MKKQLIAALVLVAAAIGATTPSWAFQSLQRSTVTAGTFVGGARLAQFTLKIRDTSNPFGADRSSVTWSGASSGGGWKIADRLLVINSTVTDSFGGIQFYTENTAADASPKFTDPTPADIKNADSAAAGLVNAVTPTQVLPMAWAIKSSTKIVEGTDQNTGIGATDPNTGTGTGANNPSQWLFVTDRYNVQGIDFNGDGNITSPGDSAAFKDGMPFITMIGGGGTLHVTQGDNGFVGGSPSGNSYVYMQADFTHALAQTAYQTTTLRVEAFIQ